jgi:hypothetical protein
MPVTLLSSKMLVFTESTVMVGPPDFSTTRSPDLIAVIGRFHGQQCVGAPYLNRSSHAAPIRGTAPEFHGIAPGRDEL